MNIIIFYPLSRIYFWYFNRLV